MNEKIIINDALTFVDGYNTLNAYVIQLPNFNFDNAVFKMYYGEAIDDTKISLLKCSNFNFDDYECSGNWTSVPITLVRNQTMAVANVKTFSVYSLVEPEDLEETTTTTTETTSTTQTSPQTTTSNPSQSGGQGGSSNNQLTTTTQSTQTSSVSQITTQTSSTSISQTQTKTSDSSASVSSSEFNPFIIPILILIIFAGVLFYMKHPTKKHKTKRYGEKVKLSFD